MKIFENMPEKSFIFYTYYYPVKIRPECEVRKCKYDDKECNGIFIKM